MSPGTLVSGPPWQQFMGCLWETAEHAFPQAGFDAVASFMRTVSAPGGDDMKESFTNSGEVCPGFPFCNEAWQRFLGEWKATSHSLREWTMLSLKLEQWDDDPGLFRELDPAQFRS